MLTDPSFSNDHRQKFLNRRGGLRGFAVGLGLLAAGALNGCADDEPHYLPPLPDMRSTATAGVPCEVIKLVADHCIACHNQPPVISGQALVSYADLTALSTTDVTQKVAARMLARMQSPTSPMPPGAAPTIPAAEYMPLQTWVTAGTPMTACTSAALAP